MNIINALTQENQDTFKRALALLAQDGNAESAEALRAQLAGETRLVIKHQMRDWMHGEAPDQMEEGDGDPFDVEIDLDSHQPCIAFFRNGNLAGELRTEIDKGTPAVQINTTEDSALAHIYFAQGGVVVVTDSPDVVREPAMPDRYAYHEGGLLMRHSKEEWMLEDVATQAFEVFDFGFQVTHSGKWDQDGLLNWMKNVHGETDDGTQHSVSFHVKFDSRYEAVVLEAYALDLATGAIKERAMDMLKERPETNSAAQWPAEYQNIAASEGWGLFETDGAVKDAWRNDVMLINRDDDANRFESDKAALQHVIERAKEGSAAHCRALELHMTLREVV